MNNIHFSDKTLLYLSAADLEKFAPDFLKEKTKTFCDFRLKEIDSINYKSAIYKEKLILETKTSFKCLWILFHFIYSNAPQKINFLSSRNKIESHYQKKYDFYFIYPIFEMIINLTEDLDEFKKKKREKNYVDFLETIQCLFNNLFCAFPFHKTASLQSYANELHVFSTPLWAFQEILSSFIYLYSEDLKGMGMHFNSLPYLFQMIYSDEFEKQTLGKQKLDHLLSKSLCQSDFITQVAPNRSRKKDSFDKL